jgi:hypothetical protein
LLDGRVLWLFSDSFLGAVGSNGSRGPSGLLHNQIVVQDSATASAEWPAAAIQSALNQVQVVLRCIGESGSVVRLDLATLTINSGTTGWTVSIDTTNFNSAALVQTPTCYPAADGVAGSEALCVRTHSKPGFISSRRQARAAQEGPGADARCSCPASLLS